MLLKGGPIRLGDDTTGGGKAISASAQNFTIKGVPVVLKGDLATCVIHNGVQTFVEGCQGRTVNGVGIVLEGHKLSCGCTAISSCRDFCWIEDCVPASFNTSVRSHPLRDELNGAVTSGGTLDKRCNQWFIMRDSSTGELLRNHPFAAHVDGMKTIGRSDANGYARVGTDSPQQVRLHATFVAPRRALNADGAA